MVVLSYKGSTYQLKNLADEKLHSVHVSRLEVFRYDVTTVDPQAVAAKDLEEYVIEQVLAHNPTHSPSKHKKELEFLIKWRGYGEEDNEWVKQVARLNKQQDRSRLLYGKRNEISGA